MGGLTSKGVGTHTRTVIGGCAVLLVILFILSLCIGRYEVGFIDCLKILSGVGRREVDSTAQQVVLSLRLPRAVAAALVGAALSASGLAFQSTFQNKLASPDILGASSGACVGAALAILFDLPSISIGLFAFFFGVGAVGLTLRIPHWIRDYSTLALVLSGMIVSSLMNALVGAMKFIADPNRQLAEITYWIMGSIAGVQWREITVAVLFIAPALTVMILFRWRLNILSQGETVATTLGIPYRQSRRIVILCATLLTAASVSISGSVGWVGLAIPHCARFMVGEDHRYNLPASVLLGAGFMVFVDLVARSCSMNEIPLSIVTGCMGALLYLSLLVKRRSGIQ